MSKKHHRPTRHLQESHKMPAIRWPTLAVIGGVVLLVALVLLLKDWTADPSSVAESRPQATATLPESVGQTQAATELEQVRSHARATASPKELPEAQLGRLLAVGQPVLGFYHSTNCAKCIEMMATVAEVYPEFKDSVGLVDVNVYDKANTKLLQVARIYAIPTQIFYDKSGQQKTVLGVMTAEELREQLRILAGGQ